ncbi:ABC1 kinase family protein [Nocardioides sp. URHA0032]|uniref:ABC1 kinase family protein n=1 Tax=Nocardioides sp. URHA0032 TaxID=1380388 RepID=UPI00055E830D|nr:AarF/UbiB family protein [Nocardioides sp. URHA0032]
MSFEQSSTGRYAAIARLLVRHGRSDLVSGARLDEYALNPVGDDPVSDKAEAFAADLESMGPTFIKLGQLLSTRFDLLPASYTTALSRLQDEVEPFDFEIVRTTIAEDLGADVRHLFAELDPEPVAAASLGQVHRAVLRSGREVAVKVQRPGVRDEVRADLATLARIATVADKGSDLGRTYGFAGLLREFERSLRLELDYRREARNLMRFADLTRRYDLLVVPDPVLDLTSGRVLTMDFVEGRKVTDVGPLGLLDLDTAAIVDQLFSAYLKCILEDGFLHADPHPGNVLVTTDGRLGILDLGMVTTIPPRLQEKVVRLLVAIGDDNGEQAARVLADMGQPLEHYDAEAFRDDVTHLVAEAVATGPDLQAGRVLVELSRVSGAHGLRPPPEMSMVGKALLNLDQTTLHLEPDFVPAEAIRDNLPHILRGGLRTSPGDLVTAALDAKEFTSQLPRRANQILDSLADGRFRLRVDAVDEERLHTVLQRLANRVTLGLVIAATILGASLLMQVPTDTEILGYPAIAIVLFTVAILGGAALAAWIVVTDRKVARTELRAQKDAPRL